MTKIIDILKYIHKEDISLELAAEVEGWIAASAENKKIYDELLFIYRQRHDVLPELDIDVDQSWSQYYKILKEKYPDIELMGTRPKSKIWRYLVWMLVLVGISAAVYFYFKKPEYIINENIQYAQRNVRLPDGTSVGLEKDSRIQYKRQFEADSIRRVYLTGDAVFDVAKNPSKPFIVEVNGAGIEVLGTVFEISLDSAAATIENKEGLIKCFELKKLENNIVLKEGDKAIWDGSSFDYIPAFVPPPPTPLGQNRKIYRIIDYLSERFERELEFSPYMRHTGNQEVFVYYDQSLQGILHQLDSTASIEYHPLPGGRYYLNRLDPK